MTHSKKPHGLLYFSSLGLIGFVHDTRTYDLQGHEFSLVRFEKLRKLQELRVEAANAEGRGDFDQATSLKARIQVLIEETKEVREAP